MQRTTHFTGWLAVGLALALTLGVAGFAGAQYDNGTTTGTTNTMNSDKTDVTGTVVTSTGSTLSIRTDDGTTMTFSRDATSFVPSTLKAGDRIRVSYGSATDGGQLVSSVTLLPMSTTSTTTTGSNYNNTTSGNNYPNNSSTDDELPRTASPLGAIGLLGLVSLGLGLLLRKPVANVR